ncbi:hypothetical protein [Paenirhodobacter populi]|uniref:Uncharacterized protein n=1 Tax=Paenirhodobacter populi TaxID=2306993 RepID=A0A443J077_9RHOB|nr:hypothetical protein [Sinirhodobacter populi]RWR13829.1 hypothetical protein D2T33_05370 [Sinirhodobacter populi]
MEEEDPVRLTILKRFTDEIASRAGLPDAVFRGRDYFGENEGDPTPMATIFEDIAGGDDYPAQTKDGAASLVSLPLILVGFDHEDRLNPTDPATRLMYRVINAIKGIKADGRKRNGDLLYLGMEAVDRIEIGSGHVYPAGADGATNIAFFRLPVTLVYAED